MSEIEIFFGRIRSATWHLFGSRNTTASESAIFLGIHDNGTVNGHGISRRRMNERTVAVKRTLTVVATIIVTGVVTVYPAVEPYLPMALQVLSVLGLGSLLDAFRTRTLLGIKVPKD